MQVSRFNPFIFLLATYYHEPHCAACIHSIQIRQFQNLIRNVARIKR